jgi:RNA polymerase primary sigma factor
MREYTITDRCDTITKYFKELKESELLTIEEEVNLATRINEGDEDAVETLIKSNLKFVVSIAKEYQGLGLPLPDLISDGNVGLIKAAKKFDVTRGVKFISYAVWWIRQSVMQSLNENSRIIRLPTNVINKLGQLNKQALEYEDIMTGAAVIDEQYPTCVSLNEPIRNSKSDISEMIDFVSEEPTDDFGIFDIEINKLRKTINDTLSILDKRERGIIECYYGLNRECEPMTLESIGDKYGLTKERIRQIKEKAIRRLRQNNEGLYMLLNQ